MSATTGAMKSFKNKSSRAHHLRAGQTNRINTLMELLETYKIRSHCLFCAVGLRARRGRGIPTRCAVALECAAAIRGTPVTRRLHRYRSSPPSPPGCDTIKPSLHSLSTHFPKLRLTLGKKCHSKPLLIFLCPNLSTLVIVVELTSDWQPYGSS
ncbi:unnamed protein product [Arctia plantaginis]|uniref:Uncharacterized protein n=1 Tax=Arctia plantaginis TaxID=874455 RepID=A0A8S1BMH2_ARCPL|nr:unnamed protein product [Arctia plantaginis]